MAGDPANFDIPLDLIRFERPLFHLEKQLKDTGPITIVAIGSSSTFGEPPTPGQPSIPPYPGRLEAALRLRFPGRKIDVINKGIGGQEAPEEFKRFATDVIALAPVLTIWQVGPNAIFHDGYILGDVAAAIEAGLRWLGGRPMDVVLMDLQYAPALIRSDLILGTEHMVRLIGEVAQRAGVNVFRRYALMRHWNRVSNIGLDQLIDRHDENQLHMSDPCTEAISRALDMLISDAAARATPISRDRLKFAGVL